VGGAKKKTDPRRWPSSRTGTVEEGVRETPWGVRRSAEGTRGTCKGPEKECATQGKNVV